jgi:hypothetical protein
MTEEGKGERLEDVAVDEQLQRWGPLNSDEQKLLWSIETPLDQVFRIQGFSLHERLFLYAILIGRIHDGATRDGFEVFAALIGPAGTGKCMVSLAAGFATGSPKRWSVCGSDSSLGAVCCGYDPTDAKSETDVDGLEPAEVKEPLKLVCLHDERGPTDIHQFQAIVSRDAYTVETPRCKNYRAFAVNGSDAPFLLLTGDRVPDAFYQAQGGADADADGDGDTEMKDEIVITPRVLRQGIAHRMIQVVMNNKLTGYEYSLSSMRQQLAESVHRKDGLILKGHLAYRQLLAEHGNGLQRLRIPGKFAA